MTEGVNEQELRDMIRASIARHMALGTGVGSVGTGVGALSRADSRPHFSDSRPQFLRFTLAQGGDGDGACLIEPAVRCTHCGYCTSYGH